MNTRVATPVWLWGATLVLGMGAAQAQAPQYSARASAVRPSSEEHVDATHNDAGWADATASEALRAAEERAALAAARALVASLAPDPSGPDAGVAAPDPSRTVPRASVLGIPASPGLPRARTHFAFPPGDPAGEAARSIARRVASFPNFRAQVPGAVWHEAKSARFALRSSAACLSELARAGIKHHAVERALNTPVATPVALEAPIGGVAFVSLHTDREVELSCELALRLAPLARILRKQGVLAVGINSSYRERPKVSFHTFGLALDLMAFRTHERTLGVAEHFELSPDTHTCAAKPSTDEGKALLKIVCAIVESRLFSTILTPNYNEGHRDHVHLDARPDDPRSFLR